jgi:hypothetical protein
MSGSDARHKNGGPVQHGRDAPPSASMAGRARAQLFALLVEEFGVNEAGVELIFHLLNQMRTLERRLDLIGRALRRLPAESQTLFEAEFRVLWRISEESSNERNEDSD